MTDGDRFLQAMIKISPWSLIWTMLFLLWLWGHFSPCTGSPSPIKKKLVEKHLGLFSTLEVNSDKVIKTADDSLLELDKTSSLQKPWLMRLSQYWKKTCNARKNSESLTVRLVEQNVVWQKEGAFLFSFSANLESFEHFFLPTFVYNMEITGAIWERVSLKSKEREYATEVFLEHWQQNWS